MIYLKSMFLKLKKIVFATKTREIIIVSFFLSFASEIVLLLSLRWWRALFPPPEIESNKIVGYSQYFGYPFYFDSLYLMILIFAPLFILIIIVFLFNKWKK